VYRSCFRLWCLCPAKSSERLKVSAVLRAELASMTGSQLEEFPTIRTSAHLEYKEMKAELDKELMRAEIDANDTRLKEGDLEGLLDFAESILLDISEFWLRCSVDQKQRLQHTLFPEGLQFADGTYRTSSTCLLFNLLQPNEDKKEDLVARTGIEPVIFTLRG
jgi:hypothetical protein